MLKKWIYKERKREWKEMSLGNNEESGVKDGGERGASWFRKCECEHVKMWKWMWMLDLGKPWNG